MASDVEIAIDLTLELLNERRVAPFMFGIRYDAKKEPARVTVHRVIRGGTMGIAEFTSLVSARIWCESALLEGYTVERMLNPNTSVATASIASRRHQIEFKAMTPEQRQAFDDEIPF